MNQPKKSQMFRLLKAAHDILGEVIKRKKWLDDLEKIAVSLTSIQIAIKKIGVEDFRYEDVLKVDEHLFRNRQINIFNLILCKSEIISFESARSVGDTFVYTLDKEKKVHKLPPQYKVGNRAIGQIFVDGQECFCAKIAIEHSIESSVNMWYIYSDTLLKTSFNQFC